MNAGTETAVRDFNPLLAEFTTISHDGALQKLLGEKDWPAVRAFSKYYGEHIRLWLTSLKNVLGDIDAETLEVMLTAAREAKAARKEDESPLFWDRLGVAICAADRPDLFEALAKCGGDMLNDWLMFGDAALTHGKDEKMYDAVRKVSDLKLARFSISHTYTAVRTKNVAGFRLVVKYFGESLQVKDWNTLMQAAIETKDLAIIRAVAEEGGEKVNDWDLFDLVAGENEGGPIRIYIRNLRSAVAEA